MEELYYLQDKRSYVGNSMLFWARNNAGYTTNLDQAQKYTASELDKMDLRETDVPWKANYLLGIATLNVDIQHANKEGRK